MLSRAQQSHAPHRDAFGRALRDVRISVTDRCNFRCGYCMPEANGTPQFLPRGELLSFEEIERVARVFVQRLGATKLRITGGEPLVRRELPKLVERLARIEGLTDLALTTNGSLLTQHAQALKDAGLHRLTISLDSLDSEVFDRARGTRGELVNVLQGIEAARHAGFAPIKLNCVVQRGINEASVVPLARFAREHGDVIRFIEVMDVGTVNGWSRDAVVSAAQIRALLSEISPLVAVGGGSRAHAVAERFTYADGRGEVGIIASVTEPFCGDCTRARISADGKLLTCLFAQHGTDLRATLRSERDDDVLAAQIAGVWHVREDRYSEQRAQAEPKPRRRLEMYQLGG